MNIIERFAIRTVGKAVTISGYASYAPLPGSSHTAARILPTGLTFELRLGARRDLATVAALLSSPGSARTALPCEGTVIDDQHLVTITALRSRYSTLTPPWVDPYTGNVWLEYIDDKPRPDDIGPLDCYAATRLDLRRIDAEQIALRLLDAANGDTPVPPLTPSAPRCPVPFDPTASRSLTKGPGKCGAACATTAVRQQGRAPWVRHRDETVCSSVSRPDVHRGSEA